MSSSALPATSPHGAPAAAEEALLRAVGAPPERREIATPGGRLHSLRCGEAQDDTPPLVMLHGRGTAGALFAPTFEALAAQRRILTVDLPGWGLSEKPVFTGKTARDALDVWLGGALAFLDAERLERVDLLGHSMGGLVALALALEHPERVRRLVLVDAAGLSRQLSLDARLYFWLKPERLNARFGRRFFDATVNRDGSLPPVYGDFLFPIMSQPEVIPSGAEAFNAYVNLTGVHLSFEDRLRELERSTLLLWGDRDTLISYSTALHAARRLRYGKLVAFTGCGHMPFLQRPDVFARILNAWLDNERVPSRV